MYLPAMDSQEWSDRVVFFGSKTTLESHIIDRHGVLRYTPFSTVSLPVNTTFEYKFIRKETDGSVSTRAQT